MKIRNRSHHRNPSDHSSDHGFSLVELLVVVSIVAVLSVSSVLGFGYLGNTLKAREAAGFISDIVKQEELKVLRGDFEKAVVHILPDYLVIEEWPVDAVETLSLDPVTCNALPDNHIDRQIKFSGTGNLTQKDGEGEVIQVRPITAEGSMECIPFKYSDDLEWNYQLTNGTESSATLRFTHFNLQRDGVKSGLWITSNPGSRIEIFAPYGRKQYFRPDGRVVERLEIAVGNTDEGVSETISF